MKSSGRLQRVLLGILAFFVLSVGITPAVSAADAKPPVDTKTTAKKAAGGSVQGYAADAAIPVGTIVQLSSDNASKILPATQKKALQMYGVAVDRNQLSVTVNDSSLTNQTFVATSGTFDVLVSSQGGEVKAGDYITVSSVDGIGMNAGTDGTTVFGRAAASFNGKANVLGTTTLKDTTGKVNKTVAIGMIPVAINIQRNPNEKSTKANLPKALQRIGEAIAEKPVGPLRIYLSIGITGVSIVAAIIILYSGVRNSIISIGRNPLSKKSIFRGLLEIILTSILILIIGLFAVYLLLKL